MVGAAGELGLVTVVVAEHPVFAENCAVIVHVCPLAAPPGNEKFITPGLPALGNGGLNVWLPPQDEETVNVPVVISVPIVTEPDIVVLPPEQVAVAVKPDTPQGCKILQLVDPVPPVWLKVRLPVVLA